jgi:hypothetical protein
MRKRLLLATRGQLMLLYGAIYCCGDAVYLVLRGRDAGTIAFHAITWSVIGASIGWQDWDRTQSARALAGPLTDEQFVQAAQARRPRPHSIGSPDTRGQQSEEQERSSG